MIITIISNEDIIKLQELKYFIPIFSFSKYQYFFIIKNIYHYQIYTIFLYISIMFLINNFNDAWRFTRISHTKH